ncbi:MAG TPA: SDR family NAD(P)-dependent oxidoreductase [Verrucomicrobiae bacterium]|jgi:NAD(P)-dependent dehydrogenase (short-subunit alcohol dehydrogenase family)|nr:SDR family NAD(P)-dependent oxidoreductase [Verrucomicrobiae bacterium]
MNTGNLKGKGALITGASQGLGREMALALAAAGAEVILLARQAAPLEETARAARALGAVAHVFPADVTNETQIARVAESVLQKMPAPHILINNAGMNIRKPLIEFSLAEWRQVMDTNLTSVFLICRHFVPHMKGRGYGRVINMTSIMSHISLPGRSAYSASKAALLGLIRALALELAPDRITVNGISPGPFATEMNRPLLDNPELNAQFLAKIPLGSWGDPKDIGQLALFLCSEHADFITGTDIVVDGGWTAQ